MEQPDYTIETYSPYFKEQLVEVWERSVLATHQFLSDSDFREIREIVKTIDFQSFPVYCLLVGNKVGGFIGVIDRKVEMLFMDPSLIGKGYGKALMNFALSQLYVHSVDVNEQNDPAIRFYKKFGFEVYERTPTDDQGRNYPLLKMKLKSAIP